MTSEPIAAAPAAPDSAEAATKKRFFELPIFGAAHLPLGALSLPPFVFLPPYFATHLGVPMPLVFAIFFGARLFDIIIDPMIGSWQDRTQSAFGRRKLWMALSTAPLMFFTWLVFIGLPPGANLWLAGLAMFALYAILATMLIAHLGWAGELRTDYHGRTHAIGAIQIAGMIGAVVILLLPSIVRQTGLGDNTDAVHIMGWTVIATLPIFVLIALVFVREPKVAPNPSLTWHAQWEALRTNANLRTVLVPDLLIGVAQGVSGALFLFYFQYILGFEEQAHTLLFIYFVSGVAGVPLWIALGKRMGKSVALQAAMIYAAIVTALLFLIPAGNFWFAAVGMAIAGLHQGANALLLRAMMADVIDEDNVKTGAARGGLFFGLLLTTSKAGSAFGPAPYAILGLLFAFQADLGAANAPPALNALTWLFIGLPAAIYLLSAWSLRFYKLDETRQRALRAEIDARSQRAQSQ